MWRIMVRLGSAGGSGRSMTVTFLTSCPSFSIVHVTTILLPSPLEAVWNRTKHQGFVIFSLNPGFSIIRSSNQSKLLTHSEPQFPHLIAMKIK